MGGERGWGYFLTPSLHWWDSDNFSWHVFNLKKKKKKKKNLTAVAWVAAEVWLIPGLGTVG